MITLKTWNQGNLRFHTVTVRGFRCHFETLSEALNFIHILQGRNYIRKNVVQQTDLSNKCGSCKWSVPCKFSTKGTFGSYVECQNPNKVWHHEISKKRQRTTPKCRYYERNNNI